MDCSKWITVLSQEGKHFLGRFALGKMFMAWNLAKNG